MTPRIATRAAFTAAASLVAIAPLAGCSRDDTSQPSGPSNTPAATSPPTSISPGNADYVDGTYTVRGVYGGAPSYMTITLTLDAGTISAVTVKPMPDNNDTSRGFQERFAAAVPDEVTGKSIDELQVGALARASGCADGFNDALAKIREQAGTDR